MTIRPTHTEDRVERAKRPELKGGLAHKLSSDPFLDWVVILCIAALASLSLVGLGVSVYLGTVESLGDAGLPAGNNAAMPLDEAKLDKILSIFEGRARERASMQSSYKPPSDPSLR